jgi:hypothetical protein
MNQMRDRDRALTERLVWIGREQTRQRPPTSWGWIDLAICLVLSALLVCLLEAL